MRRCSLYILSFVLLCVLILPSVSRAQIVGEGPYLLPKDGECGEIALGVEQMFPNAMVMDDLTFLVDGGALGGNVCLQALFPEDGEFIEDLIFFVTQLDGTPIQNLADMERTSQDPLEDCWPAAVGFADYSDDDIPDIFFFNACYNGEKAQPQYDTVVYASTMVDGEVVWYEDLESSFTISSYQSLSDAVAMLRDGVRPPPPAENQAPPPPPAENQAPPPPPAENQAPSPAQTPEVYFCTFDSSFGPLTLQMPDETRVTGTYGQKGGTLNGLVQADGTIQGVWFEDNGESGQFVFTPTADGFTGSRTYSGQQGRSDEWNAGLIGCND